MTQNSTPKTKPATESSSRKKVTKTEAKKTASTADKVGKSFFAAFAIISAVAVLIYLSSYNTKNSLQKSKPMQASNQQTREIPVGQKPNVVIITTGGTIASSIKADSAGVTPELSGNDLVAQVPDIKQYANIKVHEYSKIDSKDMAPSDWLSIARLANDYLAQEDVAGVVISHGTDTMEYTAFFLEYTIQSNKPCVLTGAMLASTDLNPDGPRNLISAVRVASSQNTPDNLVGIVFNNRVISGMAVKKVHSTNLDAFEGGSHGFLANIDPEEITWLNLPIKHKKFVLPQTLPRVDIINVYPGVDDSFLNTALDNNTQGIIVVGYGAGNTNEAIAKGLDKFFEKKIPVIIDSIAPQGRSVAAYGGIGGSAYFKDKGAILGSVMSPGKARILLMLALANNIELKELGTYLEYIN